MLNSVLITGGYGFLGRAVARRFKQQGFRVIGIGRGRWAPEEACAHGFDFWLDAGVTLSSLMTLREPFELIVHCGGNGSVGFSLTNPLEDFYKTVQGTAHLLEFMRLSCAKALLIYPSSAAVYGSKPDRAIKESDALEPISPYGAHKKIVEELLASYSKNYGIRVAVIRFFSIYGPGLTKQLLWDASMRLRAAKDLPAVFWGTGDETRDWISSDDAAALISAVSHLEEQFTILNGGSGRRTTVRDTLTLLNQALGMGGAFEFNNRVRDGDPRYYHANIEFATALSWTSRVSLESGIQGYANWLKSYQDQERD
jgi:UDP-glucose 4-epimerase